MVVHDTELRMSGFMFGCAMARDRVGMTKAMATLLACNLFASWNQEIQIWHARREYVPDAPDGLALHLTR
jgi:hypothetical protein